MNYLFIITVQISLLISLSSLLPPFPLQRSLKLGHQIPITICFLLVPVYPAEVHQFSKVILKHILFIL